MKIEIKEIAIGGFDHPHIRLSMVITFVGDSSHSWFVAFATGGSLVGY